MAALLEYLTTVFDLACHHDHLKTYARVALKDPPCYYSKCICSLMHLVAIVFKL